MRLMSVRFDYLYIKYSRLYAYGADLKKILKQKELEEDFETCQVILHVLKDHKINQTKERK